MPCCNNRVPVIAAVKIVTLLDPAKFTPAILGAVSRLTGARKQFVGKAADTVAVANDCIGEYSPEEIANGYQARMKTICDEEPFEYHDVTCRPDDVARVVYALDPATLRNMSSKQIAKTISARCPKNFSAIKEVVDYAIVKNFSDGGVTMDNSVFTDIRSSLTKVLMEPDLRRASSEEAVRTL